jgi:hypothetical protein
MTTADVARTLVSLCRQGKFREAMEATYAENIVSVEAFEMPEMPGVPKQPRATRGLAGVRAKTDWWEANHIVHSATVTGPFLSAEKFAVLFAIDVTFKPNGQRHTMSEAAVYTVENGKITHEEFLYEGGPGAPPTA